MSMENTIYKKARERALYLLTARDYSFAELYKKLAANYDEEICVSVCSEMAERGYINDLGYAERKARELFEVKGFGVYRVKRELTLKGLSNDIIEAALELYEDDEAALERLEELVARKYERYLTDEKGVKRVKSALARLGYSFGDIDAVLELYDLDF